jgi:hypothetical protein
MQIDAIKEMVEWLKEHPQCTVDDYFREIFWSIEKDEWAKMSDDEIELFEILL